MLIYVSTISMYNTVGSIIPWTNVVVKKSHASFHPLPQPGLGPNQRMIVIIRRSGCKYLAVEYAWVLSSTPAVFPEILLSSTSGKVDRVYCYQLECDLWSIQVTPVIGFSIEKKNLVDSVGEIILPRNQWQKDAFQIPVYHVWDF